MRTIAPPRSGKGLGAATTSRVTTRRGEHGCRDRRDARTDGEHGGQGLEAIQARRDGPVGHVEPERVAHDEREPRTDGGREIDAVECPAIAEGRTTRREAVEHHRRALAVERDVDPLRVPRAAEAGDGIGERDEGAVHLGADRSAAIAPRNALVVDCVKTTSVAPGSTTRSSSIASPSMRPPPNVTRQTQRRTRAGKRRPEKPQRARRMHAREDRASVVVLAEARHDDAVTTSVDRRSGRGRVRSRCDGMHARTLVDREAACQPPAAGA